jgi:mannose-6-phosphate isomerase class I
MNVSMHDPWRKSSQFLAPARQQAQADSGYILYPGFPIDPGKISVGYSSLSEHLADQKQIILEGYGGVLWENVHSQLDREFARQGRRVAWHNIDDALRPENEIDALIIPFLGGDDPLFGTRFNKTLSDFFDQQRLKQIRPDPKADLNICYGTGASLSGWDGPLIYLDVPKNEIQFRSRAKSIANLGAGKPGLPKEMYKRFYFVDWPALNAFKARLLPSIEIIVDEQRPDEPTWMEGSVLRRALHQMSHNYFRVRPWFEPGPWGGHWIEKKIPGLASDVPNYAWSFELISPENGLAFQSGENLLEVSFDFLMFQENRAVLGSCVGRFGYDFPIRFDFLDTFDGGNLSIQVHPRSDYILEHFGENFTQDETYYILDCKPGAEVYLGFQDDIDFQEFRRELEHSFQNKTPIDIDRFVQKLPSDKHDLFLIPNGTIHGSGKDNLVLEISATPYIFTFKMYDWMRLDLEGNPRPLNIERAFQNLDTRRKGEVVSRTLVSPPRTIAEGQGWKVIHLPTHPVHFYDVHRLEFDESIEINSDNLAHVLMLVEGDHLLLETLQGMRQRFNYAETFVVPAAAGSYRLINKGNSPVKVIKAFLKPEVC